MCIRDSTSPVVVSGPPTGSATIDGFTTALNDRVLLVDENNPVNNGLWLANPGGLWTRPADFANNSLVAEAYVLITSGTTYAGSSWLSNTPTATIGTSAIGFVEFSLPNQITGANIGVGVGSVQLFAGKTGITLNFKNIDVGQYLTVSQNATDITIATDATNLNTISTIAVSYTHLDVYKRQL